MNISEPLLPDTGLTESPQDIIGTIGFGILIAAWSASVLTLCCILRKDAINEKRAEMAQF